MQNRKKHLGIHISQLMRYFIAFGSYRDFLGREFMQTRTLLSPGFLVLKLKSALWKCHHSDSVNSYKIYMLQMRTNMFRLSYSECCSSPTHDLLPDCNKCSTTCSNIGTGTAYPSGASEFTTDCFISVCVAQS